MPISWFLCFFVLVVVLPSSSSLVTMIVFPTKRPLHVRLIQYYNAQVLLSGQRNQSMNDVVTFFSESLTK